MTFATVEMPVELPVVKKGDAWLAKAGDKELRLSNLDKIYFPEKGYTKGDLLGYYFNISPVMLPHLVDRPLTLKRMPEGIHGNFFYEKNAPKYKPDWIKTIPVESTNKKINYMTVSDAADMLWLANLGCIEFHPLHAKGLDQTHPTYAFFDLDPMHGAPWDQVRYVASLVYVVLEQLGLRSYPKTSGSTGIQIMVPLDGSHEFLEVRRFVGAVSAMVNQADKEATTLEWEVKKRPKAVYLDVNMNREGANIAAAYSVRPEPAASVSTPFEWDEIEDITPEDNTIATIFERIESKGDLFEDVARGPGQNLDAALEQLAPVLEAFKITGKERVVNR